MSKTVIGIDFGTSNSYITLCPDDRQNKQVLTLDGKQSAIPTEILYSGKRNFDEVFPVIGGKAGETFGACDAAEQKAEQYRFCSCFKPDIGGSPEAKQNAVDFLKTILRDAKKNQTPLYPLNCSVRFGVPAEADADYRNTLKAVAQEAGYGDIELTDEPIGAMLSDIAANTFSLADMMAGYLVIDIGGGTGDFAFMRNGKIVHSWGDMYLGGRLLDDVFYQWWAEQNPDDARNAEQTGEDFFIRAYECQKLKVWFSEEINRNPDFIGKKQEGSTKITGLCKAEFERRAGNYTPSQSFRSFQEKIGKPLPEKLSGGKTVDFIQWFVDCLEDGLRKAEIRNEDICVISFAGGSSRWYFIREYCKNVLEKDDEHLRQNTNPLGAISEGIALLPAVQKEFADKKEKLLQSKPGFLGTKIMPKAEAELDTCKRRISDDIIVELFDKDIQPLLKKFRENGGVLNDLKRDIEFAVKGRESMLKESIKKALDKTLANIHRITMVRTREWLQKDFGLRLPNPEEQIQSGNLSITFGLGGNIGLDNLVLQGVMGVIFLAVVATPVGWLAGVILALGASVAFMFGGKEVINNYINNNLPIPAMLLYRFVLTDSKIAVLRSQMREKLETDISAEMNKAVEKIRAELDKMIDSEIERLSIVNV